MVGVCCWTQSAVALFLLLLRLVVVAVVVVVVLFWVSLLLLWPGRTVEGGSTNRQVRVLKQEARFESMAQEYERWEGSGRMWTEHEVAVERADSGPKPVPAFNGMYLNQSVRPADAIRSGARLDVSTEWEMTTDAAGSHATDVALAESLTYAALLGRLWDVSRSREHDTWMQHYWINTDMCAGATELPRALSQSFPSDR